MSHTYQVTSRHWAGPEGAVETTDVEAQYVTITSVENDVVATFTDADEDGDEVDVAIFVGFEKIMMIRD